MGEDGIAEEGEEEEEEQVVGPLVSKEELNLTCYNLMIDVVHSQMDTQDIERHVGLNGPHANDVLAMINKMLCTPWMQAINKCLVDTIDCEDLEEEEEAGIRDASYPEISSIYIYTAVVYPNTVRTLRRLSHEAKKVRH